MAAGQALDSSARKTYVSDPLSRVSCRDGRGFYQTAVVQLSLEQPERAKKEYLCQENTRHRRFNRQC